jgi:hypothetical protein
MATGTLRIRFDGIICIDHHGATTQAILVYAGVPRLVTFLDENGKGKSATIDPHASNIGVDDSRDIVTGSPHPLPNSNRYGFDLTSVTVSVNDTPGNVTKNLSKLEHLKTGGKHFLKFGNLVNLDANSAAAIVPITSGSLQSYVGLDGLSFTEWSVIPTLNAQGFIDITLTPFTGGTPFVFSVKSGTTIVVANESSASPNQDHFKLYALLSDTETQINTQIAPAVGFDCSNGQYP